ncbi:MAG: glutathione S-transferase N-terminal domain-containing protein [Myxococcota bacterium]
MLKVYGFSRVNPIARGNTRDLRVLWALEEMELPYELVGMDHPAHDLDTPQFRAMNPFGQLPVIDDDGVVVTESGAILLHLAHKTGRLAGTESTDGPRFPRFARRSLPLDFPCRQLCGTPKFGLLSRLRGVPTC